MSTANLTRAETAERSRVIDVLGYRVELDVLGAVDPEAGTFATPTTVEFAARTSTTWLDFLGADVESVTVNGDNHHLAKTALIGKIGPDGLIYTDWSSGAPIEPDPYLKPYPWASSLSS